LHGGNGRLARLGYKTHGFVVERIVLLGIGVLVLAGHTETGHTGSGAVRGNGINVVGFAACAPVGHYAMHFVVGDEGTVDALCDTTAGRQEEHVTVPEQLLRATLTEDGARVDLRLHHEGQTRRNVGLDEAGEY